MWDALLSVLTAYGIQLLLHKYVPARNVTGYCADFAGKPLLYRLNGLRVLLLVDALYLLAWSLSLADATYLARNYFQCWTAGVVLGTLLSTISYILGVVYPPADARYLRCVTSDMVAWDKDKSAFVVRKDPILDPGFAKKWWVVDFFNGWEFNPRLWGVDVKMMLYSWGASLLHLNILSMAAWHFEQHGYTHAMITYTVQFTWFLVEYCYFEEIHLYTYDLFAEKIGFKLLFGAPSLS
ncbi:hypothetical protein HDU91_006820 [Kappamyces sp. JEL0680]|nr:hypothetical protein HDU91_006820 [Kappamyces sp. JEL0680]